MNKFETAIVTVAQNVRKQQLLNITTAPVADMHTSARKKDILREELERVTGKIWRRPNKKSEYGKFDLTDGHTKLIVSMSNCDHTYGSVSSRTRRQDNKNTYILSGSANLSEAILVPLADFQATVSVKDLYERDGKYYFPMEHMAGRFSSYRI